MLDDVFVTLDWLLSDRLEGELLDRLDSLLLLDELVDRLLVLSELVERLDAELALLALLVTLLLDELSDWLIDRLELLLLAVLAEERLI